LSGGRTNKKNREKVKNSFFIGAHSNINSGEKSGGGFVLSARKYSKSGGDHLSDQNKLGEILKGGEGRTWGGN